MLAELVGLGGETLDEQVVEFDRRWATYVQTCESYDHADVEAWLKTVGAPDYRSFDEFKAGAKRP